MGNNASTVQPSPLHAVQTELEAENAGKLVFPDSSNSDTSAKNKGSPLSLSQHVHVQQQATTTPSVSTTPKNQQQPVPSKAATLVDAGVGIGGGGNNGSHPPSPPPPPFTPPPTPTPTAHPNNHRRPPPPPGHETGEGSWVLSETERKGRETSTMQVLYDVPMTSDRVVGKGHYGIVRKGIRNSDGLPVAVKTVHKKRLMYIDMIKREIIILQAINHPNIIKLLDVFEDEKYVHLLFEFCDSGELFEPIADTQFRFSERQASRIVRRVLFALRACYREGVIHRDLKPENILLSSAVGGAGVPSAAYSQQQQQQQQAPLAPTFGGVEGDIRVIDFELSAVLAPNEFLRRHVGTPYYMAPEVLKHSYSFPADMWSLGVIAYTLMSGYPPFLGDNEAQIYESIARGVYSYESPEWNGRSNACLHFISSCLESQPEKRLTIHGALFHPWILHEGPPLDIFEMLQRQTQLVSFYNIADKEVVSGESNNNNNNLTEASSSMQQQQQQQQQADIVAEVNVAGVEEKKRGWVAQMMKQLYMPPSVSLILVRRMKQYASFPLMKKLVLICIADGLLRYADRVKQQKQQILQQNLIKNDANSDVKSFTASPSPIETTKMRNQNYFFRSKTKNELKSSSSPIQSQTGPPRSFTESLLFSTAFLFASDTGTASSALEVQKNVPKLTTASSSTSFQGTSSSLAAAAVVSTANAPFEEAKLYSRWLDEAMSKLQSETEKAVSALALLLGSNESTPIPTSAHSTPSASSSSSSSFSFGIQHIHAMLAMSEGYVILGTSPSDTSSIDKTEEYETGGTSRRRSTTTTNDDTSKLFPIKRLAEDAASLFAGISFAHDRIRSAGTNSVISAMTSSSSLLSQSGSPSSSSSSSSRLVPCSLSRAEVAACLLLPRLAYLDGTRLLRIFEAFDADSDDGLLKVVDIEKTLIEADLIQSLFPSISSSLLHGSSVGGIGGGTFRTSEHNRRSARGSVGNMNIQSTTTTADDTALLSSNTVVDWVAVSSSSTSSSVSPPTSPSSSSVPKFLGSQSKATHTDGSKHLNNKTTLTGPNNTNTTSRIKHDLRYSSLFSQGNNNLSSLSASASAADLSFALRSFALNIVSESDAGWSGYTHVDPVDDEGQLSATAAAERNNLGGVGGRWMRQSRLEKKEQQRWADESGVNSAKIVGGVGFGDFLATMSAGEDFPI